MSIDYFSLLEDKLKERLGDDIAISLVNSSDARLEMKLVRNNTSIIFFRDNVKDVFGFRMLQGGVKTYPSLDNFIVMFSVYVYIHAVFIPRAKKLSSLVDEDQQISTVYKTFKGNMDDGFVAIFQVLGKESSVHIVEGKPYYSVKMIDGDNNITAEYSYKLLEDESFQLALTVDSYINRIIHECFSSEFIHSCNRLSNDTIEIEWLDNPTAVIKVSVSVDENVALTLIKLNDVELSSGIDLEDCFDTVELGAKVNEALRELEVLSDASGNEGVSEEVLEESVEEELIEDESTEEVVEEEFTEDESVEESVEEEPTEDEIISADFEDSSAEVTSEDEEWDSPAEDVADDEEVFEEPETDAVEEESVDVTEEVDADVDNVDAQEESTQEESVSEVVTTEVEEVEEAMSDVEFGSDTVVIKRLEREGIVEGAVFIVNRFKEDTSVCICSLDDAKAARLPLHRVVAVDTYRVHNGIEMLQSEIELKTFAEDISGNTELVQRLVKQAF